MSDINVFFYFNVVPVMIILWVAMVLLICNLNHKISVNDSCEDDLTDNKHTCCPEIRSPQEDPCATLYENRDCDCVKKVTT